MRISSRDATIVVIDTDGVCIGTAVPWVYVDGELVGLVEHADTDTGEVEKLDIVGEGAGQSFQKRKISGKVEIVWQMSRIQ